MKQSGQIQHGRELLKQLADICRALPDDKVDVVFRDGTLDGLLNAIFNPTEVAEFPSIAEFFLANKHRSAIIAGIRSGISRSCAIQGTKDGVPAYVSPTDMQWFDDAVMFLEGKGPFEGLICKYQNGRMSYAIAARDVDAGDEMGPDAFTFVDIEETKKRLQDGQPRSAGELEAPIEELRALMDANDSNESAYQDLLEHYPWVLGLQYKHIQRHEQLDDQNIPDFSGVRVSDACRDIFEIKPPTMPVFRADGEFTARFNAAWNQAERYLGFARQEAEYLLRKGYRYDNPKCILVCGFNLRKEQIKKIRVKEHMNPAIQVLTFNDLLKFMESTVAFIKKVARSRTDVPDR